MARLQQLLILVLSAGLLVAGAPRSLDSPRAEPPPQTTANATTAAVAASTNVQNALYDGSCYYPTPDPNFPADLTAYTGRWYQVAGTPQIFTLGCRCIYAEYGLTEDGGAVTVQNVCQLPLGIRNEIKGEAAPVDAAYGAGGAFQVRFSIVPGGGVLCPGPNYIVQKYDENYAIVQGPAWQGLFILSREQHPAEEDLDAWIQEAGALGTNVNLVTKISQDNCKYT